VLKSEKEIRVILWDIDGTLIENQNSSSKKHALAVNKIMGVNIQELRNTSGMTDLQIITEITRLNSLHAKPSQVQLMLEALEKLTNAEHKSMPAKANLNVENILKETILKRWQNGILTGNTEKRARLKIRSANLTKYFNFEYSFFGNMFSDREKLVEHSIEYLSLKNIKRTVIVGDTPLDIISAKKQNVPVIAIATGNFAYNDLIEFGPDGIVKNLATENHLFLSFLDTLVK
jgi:phosphoglycolate phosphatase-like HAD superfamily hydrolase